MRQYSVEFFDRQLNYAHHDWITDPDIDCDYLTPQASSIEIAKTTKVPESGFVRLLGDASYFGVISEVEDDDDLTKVSVKPFICLFDSGIRFDTALQNTDQGLELTIAHCINEYWVDTTDEMQRLPLNVTADTNTTNWSFDLKGSSDKTTYNIINLMNDLIIPALEKYSIAISVTPDFGQKVINVAIRVNENVTKIDVDNEFVKLKSYVNSELKGVTNKLEIWNSDTYAEKVTYYLHPDLSYDTENRDRVTPVISESVGASVQNGSDFVTQALEEAKKKFEDVKHKNYVEIEVIPQDRLINPVEFKIGQFADIYHEGKVMEGVLTCYQISDVITLIFGTVRMDYTKQRQQDEIDAARPTSQNVTPSGEAVESYEELSGKPSINGVTVSGNKTAADYGITYGSLPDKPSIEHVVLQGDLMFPNLNLNTLTNTEIENALNEII